MGKLLRFFALIVKSPAVQALAPVAIGAFAPGLLPLVELSVRTVVAAEGAFGAGKGSEKAEYAHQQALLYAPVLVRGIEQMTGKELVDEELFGAALRQLNEGAVMLMNAFRILPKEPQK